MGGGEGGSGGVVNQCVTVESEKLIDDSVALEKGSRSMKHINRYHSIANQMPLPPALAAAATSHPIYASILDAK